VAGVDLDAVAELDEAAQRVEEAFGPLARLDRQVRPGGVADEERVAGQHEPRLRPARAVDDGDAAVLRAVARRVDAAQDDLSEGDLVAVLHRIVRVLGAGERVHAHRQAVLEREAPVARDVVRVRVRLDDAHEPHSASLRLLEVLLDGERRVDHGRDPGVLVADQVGRAPERVVDELREDHDARPYQPVPLSLLKWRAR